MSSVIHKFTDIKETVMAWGDKKSIKDFGKDKSWTAIIRKSTKKTGGKYCDIDRCGVMKDRV
jgi:hypothetical protein